ncbi:hypothetical protein BJ912DRAFT_937056 [Pholiota molesta]|nr:hypothetical protein BJ912DRAFT_937056 [Pholiota molesta]
MSQAMFDGTWKTNLDDLTTRAYHIFVKWSFRWQLESALAILCRKDDILDVGTGGGKTLCLLLALILSETDVGLTISPLLMIEQENNYPPPTVAICQETMGAIREEQFYEKLPYIALTSGEVVSVQIMPPLEFFEENFPKDAKTIRVTNAQTNVALLVRVMKHPDESKADLHFIIPLAAQSPENIPITLVKRQLEEQLVKGEIRTLFCTTAQGMGCNLRNIACVVLWAQPTSFRALEAGQAGRDLETQGEAILSIPKSLLKVNFSRGLLLIESSTKPEKPLTIGGIHLEDLDISEPEAGDPSTPVMAAKQPKVPKQKDANVLYGTNSLIAIKNKPIIGQPTAEQGTDADYIPYQEETLIIDNWCRVQCHAPLGLPRRWVDGGLKLMAKIGKGVVKDVHDVPKLTILNME